MPQVKIVDQARFEDANVSGLQTYNRRKETVYKGTVDVQVNGVWKAFTGEHGAYDFMEEFGFVIEKN